VEVDTDQTRRSEYQPPTGEYAGLEPGEGKQNPKRDKSSDEPGVEVGPGEQVGECV
jgi:hypothetical protein